MAVTEQELAEFERDVTAWAEENKPADPSFLLPQSFLEVGSEEQVDFLRNWQRKVWEAGYIGVSWPKEYGGQGIDFLFQRVVDKALAKARTPIIFNSIGLNWAGPLILDFGSDEDKAKHLKNILSGEDIWCQGFSEPDHGSDLGSVQTRAVKDGDDYVVNGSKIWTTLGNFSKYMILLARTEPMGERKYDGLSFFLAPIDIDGVEAQPIRKVTGEYGFNQMFFTDARVPASTLIGGEGNGWKMAMRTLEYERGVRPGAASGYMITRTSINDLIESLKGYERDGEPVLADPLVRDQLVQFIIEEKALLISQRRGRIKALTTDYPNALPLSGKLRGSEYDRRMRQFAIEALGADSALYVGDDNARDGGYWQRAYMNNFSTTIGGGTSEVLRNLVAEHVLGLPK